MPGPTVVTGGAGVSAGREVPPSQRQRQEGQARRGRPSYPAEEGANRSDPSGLCRRWKISR